MRSSTGQTSEKGISIRRYRSTTAANRKFYADFPDGKQYWFSYANPTGNGKARLEYIKDAGALNTVTFLYDTTYVSTAKVTKVQGPQGDVRHFALSYNGSGYITKVELKNNSTVLDSVTYAYGSARLTKVTDSNGLTVQYTYGNAGGGSGYITSITDKDAKQTSLGWYFEDTADALWGAYKIYVTDASGMVQQLERSEVSCIDTVTQNTGGDDLSKQVLTPLVGDASRTRYNDEYASASTYDRWEYQYDAGKDLTRAVRPDSTVEADYLYTSTGRMSQVTDAGGATTRSP